MYIIYVSTLERFSFSPRVNWQRLPRHPSTLISGFQGKKSANQKVKNSGPSSPRDKPRWGLIHRVPLRAHECETAVRQWVDGGPASEKPAYRPPTVGLVSGTQIKSGQGVGCKRSRVLDSMASWAGGANEPSQMCQQRPRFSKCSRYLINISV